MSEHENNIDNNDIVDELPQIEAPIKNKKPVSPERYEQLKQARLKGAEKKKEMKELKTKAKQLPIEEMKISAMKYDQLQKQKEEIIKPVEKEIIAPVEKEITKPEKPKDKKKRIIKKIVYEDGSEDEIEDLRHVQPQQQHYNNNRYMKMFSNDDSYTNLVYQSACDRLKEKVQDERTKYLIKSLMPNYG
jgi:DNA repair exonuclease SbcCD ATPase subunit